MTAETAQVRYRQRSASLEPARIWAELEEIPLKFSPRAADRYVVRKIVSLSGVILLLALVPSAEAACVTTTSSTAQAIPSRYLALYRHWGAHYGVPWPILAGVGRIESDHGRNPAAYRPHHRGVLGPMQFQAGSNRAARHEFKNGDQGRGGTWALYRTASGHPPYRMDSADDEIAASAAKLVNDAGPNRRWRRALYRYNAWDVYVRWVLGKARRYGLRCGAVSARISATTVRPAISPSRVPQISRAALLGSASISLARPAAHDVAHGIADVRVLNLLDWIARRHHVHVQVIKTGHSRTIAGTHKISNHWYGRAASITAVDGRPVQAGSRAARALWRALLHAPASIRPTELGAPWVASADPRSFFERSEIHIGFDGP